MGCASAICTLHAPACKHPAQVSDYVERELMTHRILNHAHIIKFRGTMIHPIYCLHCTRHTEAFLTKHHLAVVLEYADGGDMYDYVVSRKRLSENKVSMLSVVFRVAATVVCTGSMDFPAAGDCCRLHAQDGAHVLCHSTTAMCVDRVLRAGTSSWKTPCLLAALTSHWSNSATWATPRCERLLGAR